ncbi:MAG: HAD-IIB family hydrolase [Gloeobacteraceae cyanobacterium ES-bin-144]|nr:HAD-IIB family hydrolase [Verrucomicrobiales bacterium]
MKTLPPPASPSAILSFDFDGTLHDPAGDPPVPNEFFETVRRLRKAKQVAWGINTGRSMEYVVEGLIESRFPFLPDWVVAREREIYFPNNSGGWMAHEVWNKPCREEIHGLFTRVAGLLGRIRREIEEHTGAQWLEMEGEPAGLISRTEAEMEWIVGRIAPLVATEPQLAWQRNSIYLRFGHRDYQKGSSLSEIARLYQLSAAACFAMGDSYNDVEMLDPTHAGMAACPGNSVDEIKAIIRANGGLVTEASYGKGAVEALTHFFGDSTCAT